MIRPVICICDKCSCMSECDYYEETIKPIITGAKTMIEEDEFTTRIKDALSDYKCEYFE